MRQGMKGRRISLLHAFYQRHQLFFLILLLFISFRLLAILLFRPGGFIADASDYDFYYAWGQQTPMGKRVFDNMWTAYPPLFPAIMLPIFEWSSRLPAWIDPRLFFHTFFGALLLFFESANLLWIYRLAGKISGGERTTSDSSPLASFSPATLSALLYALLFTPVYTMLGWFEPMPLFFMLLGLDLLLSQRSKRYSIAWLLSAVVAALGFLTKLTPILLVPIAVRWFGARLSWRAARAEWFRPSSKGNLLRPVIYSGLFVAVVVAVGYPLVRANPALAFSAFRIQAIRAPWQSLWALLDGYYAAGVVHLRMDNLVGLNTPLWQSSLPWTWISVAFLLIYLWLYTRPYDWERPRTPVAFAAISVIVLFLYSKGWSPQFLVWILAFIVLLLPTLRGVSIAIALSLINVIEAQIYLILLNHQTVWLLWGTVLLRTGLLLLLLVEFLGQIWPKPQRAQQLRRWSANLSWLTLLVAVVGAIVATPRAAEAYRARRWSEHPCQEAITLLHSQAAWPNRTIVTGQIELWRDFYPWLRNEYDIRVLDTYSPSDEDPSAVAIQKLSAIGAEGEFWWIEYRSDAGTTSIPVRASRDAQRFFALPNVTTTDRQELGACLLQRVLFTKTDTALATLDAAGGSIHLLDVRTMPFEPETLKAGGEWHLVLYWLADAQIDESYAVFTQLFDPSGKLVAQKDNLPVRGLAPTDRWQPNLQIRDPYTLTVPETAADASTGPYELHIGMYNDKGRLMLTTADGTESDHLTLKLLPE